MSKLGIEVQEKMIQELEDTLASEKRKLEHSSKNISMKHRFMSYCRSEKVDSTTKLVEKIVPVGIDKNEKKRVIQEESLLLDNVLYTFYFDQRSVKHRVKKSSNSIYDFDKDAEIFGVPMWVLHQLRRTGNCFVPDKVYTLPRFKEALKIGDLIITKVKELPPLEFVQEPLIESQMKKSKGYHTKKYKDGGADGYIVFCVVAKNPRNKI